MCWWPRCWWSRLDYRLWLQYVGQNGRECFLGLLGQRIRLKSRLLVLTLPRSAKKRLASCRLTPVTDVVRELYPECPHSTPLGVSHPELYHRLTAPRLTAPGHMKCAREKLRREAVAESHVH